MLSILICCTPVHGHVAPSLAVARGLVAAGHDVRFLTGVRYRSAVEAVGARWLPLPVEADYDDRDMDASFPGRVGLTGVAGARWDLLHIFLEPAAAQLRAVDDALAAQQVGQQITGRDLNRQPTLMVRAGWPLRVLVSKDMILAPYP